MEDARLLGRLALHFKLLSEDQLVAALDQQRREGDGRMLGEILVERGDLTAAQLQQLFAAQRRYLDKVAASATATIPIRAPAATAAPASLAVPAEAPPLALGPDPAAPEPAAPRSPDTAATPSRPATGGARETALALLRIAVARQASDLHLHAGAEPRIRVAGRFTVVPFGILDAETSAAMIRSLLADEDWHRLEATGQADLALSLPALGRFRVNAYRQQRGTDAVFRVVPPEPPSLLDLGLPADLARLANFRQGLVLLTGPSGCGKTATLAALVRILNEERRDHILTIEDPVEVLHRPQRSVVNQRQVGRDTASFASALRGALREDPDVIVIGELRDLETISLALTAAETGHLVLASMHTTNTVATINRILGAFPPEQQGQVRLMISESLRAVVSQRLLPRADGAGRVPALEVLWCTRAVSNLIREGKNFQIRSVLQTGAAQGMCLLDASLEALVKAGRVRAEDARRAAEDPKKFAG